MSADHRIKLKECGKKDKYLDLAGELKKLWNIKVTIIPTVIGAFGTVTKVLINGLKGTVLNGQNTAKSPVNLKRRAVTQAPVKDYQLTLI